MRIVLHGEENQVNCQLTATYWLQISDSHQGLEMVTRDQTDEMAVVMEEEGSGGLAWEVRR